MHAFCYTEKCNKMILDMMPLQKLSVIKSKSRAGGFIREDCQEGSAAV